MFSTIKAYIYAGAAAIFAIGIAWIKILTAQKKQLKRDNAALEKKDQINDDMHLAEVKAEKKERQENEKIDTDDTDPFNDI